MFQLTVIGRPGARGLVVTSHVILVTLFERVRARRLNMVDMSVPEITLSRKPAHSANAPVGVWATLN